MVLSEAQAIAEARGGSSRGPPMEEILAHPRRPRVHRRKQWCWHWLLAGRPHRGELQSGRLQPCEAAVLAVQQREMATHECLVRACQYANQRQFVIELFGHRLVRKDHCSTERKHVQPPRVTNGLFTNICKSKRRIDIRVNHVAAL